MLNFTDRHSLKRKFQAVLTVLVSARGADQSESLTKLIDYLITGNLPQPSEPQDLQIQAIILGLYNHQDLSGFTEYFLEPEYLATALTIAICLRGEMQPRTLVTKLSNYLKPYPDFCDHLHLANTLAERGSSRAIAKSIISEDTLAFGLYCFLSTPYSWNLVNRGTGQFQISISAIAAAYLGYIPKNLELGMNLGDRLLAAWAGVYDLQNIPNGFYPAIKYPQIRSLGA